MNTTPHKPSLLGREPVMWIGLVQAGLALAIGFGFEITTEQMALILTFTTAVLSFVARSQVTPTGNAENAIEQALVATPGVDARPTL